MNMIIQEATLHPTAQATTGKANMTETNQVSNQKRDDMNATSSQQEMRITSGPNLNITVRQ